MKIEEIFTDQNFFTDWRGGSGFKTEVIPMKYTPFYCQIFHPYSPEFDESELRDLFVYYLKNYQPKKDSQAQIVEAVIDFIQGFDAKKILETIKSGEKRFELKIPLDGTIFRIKRIGNVLGFQLRSGNGDNDIHQAGTKFMKESCRNIPYHWGEFIKRVVFTIPIIKKQSPNNALFIDLGATFYDELDNFLRLVKLDKHNISMPTKLIENYKDNYQEKVFDGRLEGVERWFRLVHLDRNLEEKELTAQFRRGNVSKVEAKSFVWEFMDGERVFLQIGLDCMIKDTFMDSPIPVEIDTSGRQFVLRKWAMAMQ